jgi:hypothetical protein
MFSNEILENRFNYHVPTAEKVRRHETIRNLCFELAKSINTLCPDCRETSVAITNLELVMMWSNAAIARNNIETKE